MNIIGITGPSGCGKGYLSAELAKLGYVHADADEIYHSLLETSEPLCSALVSAFGEEIRKDGRIDRGALGKKVFGAKNRRKLEKLNKIAHKFVCREYIKLIRKLLDEGAEGLVIDAPLLIEARLHKLCTINVAVLANEKIRIERIMCRDGISPENALLRIHSQKPLAFYAKHCDYVFLNNGEADAAAFANELHTLIQKEARL